MQSYNVVTGYPDTITNCDVASGLVIDSINDVFWICDSDASILNKYDEHLNYTGTFISFSGSFSPQAHPQVLNVEEDLSIFYGITFDNDKIYLVSGANYIIVSDLSGNVLNKWEIEGPEDWNGNYTDIEIIGNHIYIMSQNPQTKTLEPHVLIYKEN